MKDMLKKTVTKGVSNIAMHNAKKEADAACICLFYQPQVPKALKNRDSK